LIWAKDREVMCIIGPRSHKATKADRFRSKTWEIIKRVSRDNVRELRYEGRGRWRGIPSLRCRIGK
jgi:hypothetical protein